MTVIYIDSTIIKGKEIKEVIRDYVIPIVSPKNWKFKKIEINKQEANNCLEDTHLINVTYTTDYPTYIKGLKKEEDKINKRDKTIQLDSNPNTIYTFCLEDNSLLIGLTPDQAKKKFGLRLVEYRITRDEQLFRENIEKKFVITKLKRELIGAYSVLKKKDVSNIKINKNNQIEIKERLEDLLKENI